MSTTSTTTVAAIQQGDSVAFEQVFREFYSPLVHYAMRFLSEQAAAEEVVQETFFAVWDKRSNLEVHTSIKSYLYRAVHNRCLNTIKHIGVREEYKNWNEMERNAQDGMVDAELEAAELEERIEAAIAGLPEERQRVFRMSRFEGLKYKEIADQLGISVKTVENQMGKALKSLRQSLSAYLALVLLIAVIEITKKLMGQ